MSSSSASGEDLDHQIEQDRFGNGFIVVGHAWVSLLLHAQTIFKIDREPAAPSLFKKVK